MEKSWLYFLSVTLLSVQLSSNVFAAIDEEDEDEYLPAPTEVAEPAVMNRMAQDLSDILTQSRAAPQTPQAEKNTIQGKGRDKSMTLSNSLESVEVVPPSLEEY